MTSRFYIGITADLEDRVKRHNNGHSKSTKSDRPWQIVYTEEYRSRSEASVRERQLKNWKSRVRIEQLIKSTKG